MGIHESQSLFYENFIARHYSFWKRYYSLLQQYASHFSHVSLDDFIVRLTSRNRLLFALKLMS